MLVCAPQRDRGRSFAYRQPSALRQHSWAAATCWRLSLVFVVCVALATQAFAQRRLMNVNGQVVFVNNWTVGGADGAEKLPPGFQLPAKASDVQETLEEFHRLVGHEQWEKAFKSLDTLATKTTSGFIDRGDGVQVPSRLLMRSLLASLPAGGRSAYRLFYDAQATALLDKATGGAEVDNLSKIVNSHLVSSVGDRAADRLGDLYFKRGDLNQAISSWQAIETYCPESKIPKGQLLAKVAIALARAGHSNELATVGEALRTRYASEMIEVGGQRLTAGELIARLARPPSPSIRPRRPAPADFDFPASVQPMWQFRFETKHDPNNPSQPFALTDIYGRPRANDFNIPAAADNERVYVNIFGVEMAFDLVTGKLVWRSGKLHQLANPQQPRQNAVPERYSLLVSGNRTWSVARETQNNNNNNQNQLANFALVRARRGHRQGDVQQPPVAQLVDDSGRPYLVSDSLAGNPKDAASSATVEAPPAIDFSQGFAAAASQLSFNGEPAVISGNKLQLTDAKDQKASIFTQQRVNVAAFKTRFTLEQTDVGATA